MQLIVKNLNNLIAEFTGLEGEAWTQEGEAIGVTFVCGWNRTLESVNLTEKTAKKLILAVGRLHEEFRGAMAARPPDFDTAEAVDDKLRRLFNVG